jgi:class 3 adenylate cyclase/CheY-like chemotaxis protein
MSEQPTILVVDDTELNRKLLGDLLAAKGYAIKTAESGQEALAIINDDPPDMVLLDVVMPGMDGYEVCRRIRESVDAAMLPVVMITALDQGEERIRGLEAGADDFLTKPINQPELMARVRSLMRIKQLHDKLESANRTLEERVSEQVEQLDRLSRLKRFFSPQLAELIVAGGAEDPLKSHRRQVTVVFVDLRGFTAFAETAEPEEVMGILREYHAELGTLILEHEATLERFAGDGMMIFFNDPVPVPDHTERAVRMAFQMRERGRALTDKWRKDGYELELGIGIAQGFATIGAIGFEGRWDYGAIGTVTNLAARLCDKARGGEILVSKRVHTTVADSVESEPYGELDVRGFLKAVPAFNLVAPRTNEDTRASQQVDSGSTAADRTSDSPAANMSNGSAATGNSGGD